jgi:NAD(P)H-dependent FMN reductase
MIRFLAVSGSLRRGSSNTALLEAASSLLPPNVTVTFYDALASLPAFNPDDDVEPGPMAVKVWREALAQADAVLICSPEYAHGVPGVLKNALDWVVGSGELMDKPVALLNASVQSTFAHPQLAETLTVMSARVVSGASLTIPVARRGVDGATLAADTAVAEPLRAAIRALLEAIGEPPIPSGC